MSTKQVQRLERVVIRFAGDSGDGMQLTGDRFTSETAVLGNDLSTLPNFPDLGREVGQRRDVVAQLSGLGCEPVAGELHAVARVPGETDDHTFALLDLFGHSRRTSLARLGALGLARHC